jgi:alpha-1,6-mannosyltransferase
VRTVRAAGAHASLAGLLVAGTLICLLAAAAPSGLIPSSWQGMPGWLAGPLPGIGDGLTRSAFSACFLVMCGCYLAALALARHAVPRVTWSAIVLLHAVFMLAPPLLSSVVFGYIDWARLGTVHGLDPYSHGSLSAPDDPAFDYFRWRTDMASPYGPLFTVASYATAPLGVAGALWAFKVACAAASLGCVALVASCARRLGADPLRAAALVGLNPVVLVWAVGGAHNDLLAMVVVLAGVRLAVGGRERAGAGVTTLAAAVKASAGVVLPYALLGARDRRGALAGALLAAVGTAALALAVFGTDITGLLETNRDQQTLVAHTSVPNQLGILVGAGGLTPAIRTLALTVLIAALLVTLLRTWRGADWIASAGWATFALIACSAWFMPWYLCWLLPLAAIGRDRRLVVATLVLCAYAVAMRTPF